MSPSLSKSPKAQPRLQCAAPRRAGLFDQLLEPAVAQIAEDHAAACCMGYAGSFAATSGKTLPVTDEQVGQSVVIQIHDARAPTDVARLDAESAARWSRRRSRPCRRCGRGCWCRRRNAS